ncbi:MAG TPA: FtsX-like permease family protein [Luteibaculaceae bacterium]|nr:FtsX-like permease family protein [Luteibaculaceae bacterium]
MRLPFHIAKRYLFAKKSHNAINVISAISATVVAFVVAAMVVVLSVFNGIEALVADMYEVMDADAVILPMQGKRLEPTQQLLKTLQPVNGVLHRSFVLEDEVMIQFRDKQMVVKLKGVDTAYHRVLNLDSVMVEGSPGILRTGAQTLVMGAGIGYNLGIQSVDQVGERIQVFSLPSLPKGLALAQDAGFVRNSARLGGLFSVNAEFDMQWIFCQLPFAQRCFGDSTRLSSIELSLSPNANREVLRQLIEQQGSFRLQTREEKNQLVFQTSQTEKWITFFILLFIVVIAAFNMIASLTMLIIEKRRDLKVLWAMGMSRPQMNSIFFLQSVLINLLGVLAGLLLGLSFCWAQQRFGLIRFEGSIVEFYPVKILFTDILGILLVMSIIVWSTYFAVRWLMNRFMKLDQHIVKRA